MVSRARLEVDWSTFRRLQFFQEFSAAEFKFSPGVNGLVRQLRIDWLAFELVAAVAREEMQVQVR
jgi:hypothetical protein